MHFLLTTFGSSGDVFPMLGLAVELQARGHAVTLATNAYYEDAAASADVPFVAVGEKEGFYECIRHPDLWNPTRAFRHVFGWIQKVLPRQYEVIIEQSKEQDLVTVTNLFGFGALFAQETHRIPCVTVHLQPSVLFSKYDPPHLPGIGGPGWLRTLLYRLGCRFVLNPTALPPLNEWRKSLGLSPLRNITESWHSPGGVVCLFPEWFAAPQRDWPQPLIQTNFPLWNMNSRCGLSPEIQTFLASGSPPLVFTAGSTNVHAATFFRTAVDTCQRMDQRGLLLTEFPEQLPANLPQSILHCSYVPLDQLLPHAAAFIHHGGIGSMSQGFNAGIPQIVMPLAHDQFDNAARLQRLGCGFGLPLKSFQPRQLTPLLLKLLTNDSYRENSRRLQRLMSTENGLASSAKAIEELGYSALTRRRNDLGR